MSNIILIHGAYGSPDENWFPWLKEELEKLNCKVFIPRFPTPKDQNLNSWLKVFGDYKKLLDKDSVLIDHSLGPAFILTILENLDHPIKACFLVAGFTGLLNNEEFDKINKTISDRNFNFDKIINNCKQFFVYGSDNDPYVPLEKEKELASNLKTELKLIKGAGHFNEKAGYVKFDALLEDLKKIIK